MPEVKSSRNSWEAQRLCHQSLNRDLKGVSRNLVEWIRLG